MANQHCTDFSKNPIHLINQYLVLSVVSYLVDCARRNLLFHNQHQRFMQLNLQKHAGQYKKKVGGGTPFLYSKRSMTSDWFTRAILVENVFAVILLF